VTERPSTGSLAGWRLRLIDERLHEVDAAPSLTELAALCKISVRQLTRAFRASRGCSLHAYVAERRIETAKRMLSAGEPVKSVGHALGFGSPSSFSYAFRIATGHSPSAYQVAQHRSKFGTQGPGTPKVCDAS
jgi:AraC family transcriptional regulator